MVEGSGVIHGALGRLIRDFSKGHTPSSNAYWFDLKKFLILRPSQDYPGVQISPMIKVPRVESLKVTPLGTIMMGSGGGFGGGMADADGCADEHIRRAVQRN